MMKGELNMSNLNEEDIAVYQEESESIVKAYQLNDNGGWQQLISYDTNGELISEWCGCMAVDVPGNFLLIEYENLLAELSNKEVELSKLNEKYTNKEFNIVFMSDIDFKALYGSTAEKVRKQHARMTLKSLNDEINKLELSIEWIKNYLLFLRELIRSKRKEVKE